MEISNPPTWLQNREYPARIERMMLRKFFQSSGTTTTGSMQVQAQASPNMTVTVAAGSVWVLGTEVTNQGYYYVVNDSIATVTVNQSNTSARTDIVVVRVYDKEYSGSFDLGQIEVITGTPGGGTPSTPANSYRLATITVGANVTSITNANIVDNRSLVVTNNYLVQSWVQDVPWIQITSYASNFAAHAAYTKPHYRIVGGNTLELCGLVVANTALPDSAPTVMFNLPITAEFDSITPTICGLGTVRSNGASTGTAHTHLVQQSNAEGLVLLSTSGAVSFRNDAGFVSGEYIALDGIIFHLKD